MVAAAEAVATDGRQCASLLGAALLRSDRRSCFRKRLDELTEAVDVLGRLRLSMSC
jgi:hypothetical protein